MTCVCVRQGLLARETHSMNTQGSSWNTVYTSFALTPTGAFAA
jgi:hypothetical protein